MGNIYPGRNERPELTERELSYIELHTKFTRKQIDDYHIRFLTFYPRGYVTLEQFCELYASELKHLSHARPLLERLFDRIDTDQNGQLSFKEILFFKAIASPETDHDEKLRWIFLLYDVNHDRHIDRREFLDLCQLVHYIHARSLSQTRLDQFNHLFDQFDVNNDEKLNCEEFLRLCKTCEDLLKLMTPMFAQTKWNINRGLSSGGNDPSPTFVTNDDQMDYLIKRTKFSREQIEGYYQTFHTRCRAGRLSKTEFLDFYQQLLPSTSSQTYSELIFQAFDHLSKDGSIQFDEFLIAIYIHSNSSTDREKLEWLYNAYDRDGDGLIDYDEIHQIVQALFTLHGIDREKTSVTYVAYEIMANLDLNNDDRISRQEFVNMLKDKELTSFLAPSFIKQN